MDINKSENLIENKQELKEKFEDDSNQENTPEQIQVQYNKPTGGDYLDNKKRDFISDTDSEAGQPVGKKQMEAILLNLNSYWLEFIGAFGMIFSILIYEIIALIAIFIIFPLFQGELNFDLISECFTFVVNDIGLKWLFFIKLSQHLSVGFFCMTTFSNMFRETKNIKKFYISNCIKVALFYAVSVIILKVIIKDGIGGRIHDVIDETGIEDKQKIYDVFDRIIDKALVIVADFLSTYNTFIEKLTLGTMYIFLFHEPKSLMGQKLIIFRCLSLIPIVYIIVSLVIRALHNSKVIILNEFISPILLGPKIVIYLFFISTLAIIKYKSIRYNVFDSENYIEPKVFSKIGSKCFGFLGIAEMIIGLFLPSWSTVGIGGKYLLVICAPIMSLYDYKKEYKMKFPCCKKGNFSLCLKLCVNIVGYLLIIILGIIIFVFGISFLVLYILPLVEFIIDQFDLVVEILDLVL